MFDSVLLLSPSWVESSVVIEALLIRSYQSYCWQAGYDTGRGVLDLCWTCLENLPWTPQISLLYFLYRDLMDQFEGSRRLGDTSENNCVARESSCVIILKSRLKSTGHSAHMRQVRDIFQWLMTADVLMRSQRQRPIVILHLSISCL